MKSSIKHLLAAALLVIAGSALAQATQPLTQDQTSSAAQLAEQARRLDVRSPVALTGQAMPIPRNSVSQAGMTFLATPLATLNAPADGVVIYQGPIATASGEVDAGGLVLMHGDGLYSVISSSMEWQDVKLLPPNGTSVVRGQSLGNVNGGAVGRIPVTWSLLSTADPRLVGLRNLDQLNASVPPHQSGFKTSSEALGVITSAQQIDTKRLLDLGVLQINVGIWKSDGYGFRAVQGANDQGIAQDQLKITLKSQAITWGERPVSLDEAANAAFLLVKGVHDVEISTGRIFKKEQRKSVEVQSGGVTVQWIEKGRQGDVTIAKTGFAANAADTDLDRVVEGQRASGGRASARQEARTSEILQALTALAEAPMPAGAASADSAALDPLKATAQVQQALAREAEAQQRLAQEANERQRLAQETATKEQQRVAKEVAAKEQLARAAEERERLAEAAKAKEQQRVAQEAAAKEQLARAAEERERLAEAAKAKELQRVAQEAAAKEQLARAAEDRERLAEAARAKERQRLAQESAAREQLARAAEAKARLAEEAKEMQRVAQEAAARERLAEAARAQELERVAKESRVKEQERLAKESVAKEQARVALDARSRDEELARLRQQIAKLEDAKPAKEQKTVYANRRALVIGNDAYKQVTQLVNARADASAMADSLRKVGYQVTLKLDLNEKDMKIALRTFKSQIEGGDEVLFFFAGHGVQLGASNYLLPIDIAGESEEQIKDDAMQLQKVLDDINERKAKLTLALIDACRDNPFKVAGRAIGGRGLAPTTAATGQMVIFSAGSGQQALDKMGPADKHKNGVFTRVFLKEMQLPGVSIDRILRNVRTEVVAMARSVGHEQVPAIYDQVVGDFYFSK